MAFAAKNKKWLGYMLYVVLVTLVLLYYLFPTGDVEEFVNNSISRINPDLTFEAERISPWIPAGLRINGGRIFLKDTPASAVFKSESIYIGLQILKFVSGEYAIDLSGKAYKGDIKGSFHTLDKDGQALESKLSFKDFDLAEYQFLAEKLKHRLSGNLSGDLVYAREPADPGGNGSADMQLTDGMLQFQNPIFGIGSVDLQNIDLKLEMRGGEITVVKAELAGSEVKVSISGSLQMQPDINDSQLNLKGTLEPLAEFYKKYPEIRELLKSMKKRVKRGQYFFAVTGTVAKPEFRLL